MYSRGVPVAAIAQVCRVDVKRVIHAVNRGILADPYWFGRCWLIHDQPVTDTAAQRRYAKNLDQTWWERYAELVKYMRARGGEWLGAQRGTTTTGGTSASRK